MKIVADSKLCGALFQAARRGNVRFVGEPVQLTFGHATNCGSETGKRGEGRAVVCVVSTNVP
jgi:hypothetical protein